MLSPAKGIGDMQTVDLSLAEQEKLQSLQDTLLLKMLAYDQGDAKRIQHLVKVWQFAALIGRQEKLPAATQLTLEAAAILHDIGIHLAEQKHQSAAGKYQEQEGPAPANTLMQELGYPEPFRTRVCYLIAHHHTYQAVDGLDYQILLEADFLVNAYEDGLSPQAIAHFEEKVFRTQTGKQLLRLLYQQ